MDDIVRVLRVLEYVGPRDWVLDTIAKSHVKEMFRVPNGFIRELTGTLPEHPRARPATGICSCDNCVDWAKEQAALKEQERAHIAKAQADLDGEPKGQFVGEAWVPDVVEVVAVKQGEPCYCADCMTRVEASLWAAGTKPVAP